MMFDNDWLLSSLLSLIPLLLSLSVHEWAHAWSAWRLGDDTAALQGRLTLDPFAHIDPVGTVLLPLLGVPFGWAKPVPVNPARFRSEVSMRTGLLLTAAAGPLANLCLALVCSVLLVVPARFGLTLPLAALYVLLTKMLVLNISLAIFNLLPIPPLDGSRVVDGLVPDMLRPAWDSFCQLGPVVLLLVIMLPSLFGVSLTGWGVGTMMSLFTWLFP